MNASLSRAALRAAGLALTGLAALPALAATGTYNLGQYMLPDCAAARAYNATQTSVRRTIPMGIDGAGRARYVIVTSSDGNAFLEFTIDSSWIRLWSDTSWAHDNHPPAAACGSSPYCDEVCGTSGVATSTCRCLWYHGAGSADYVYNAPRDASNTSLGVRFLPRTVSVTGENETTVSLGSVVVQARRKSNCTGCDSWHSSPPGTSQALSVAIKHMASFNGYNDVIIARGASGPGAGDQFVFARGFGMVAFIRGTYQDWINGASSSTAWPALSCFSFTQNSVCSVTNPPTGGCNTGSYPSGSWNACIYDGINFNTYAASQSWANVDFDWGTGGPAGRSDNFSVVARTTQCFSAGSYQFHTLSDDGVRLYLGSTAIINNWTDHAPTQNDSATLTLNGCYQLRGEFYEKGGGATFKVWSNAVSGGSCACIYGSGIDNYCHYAPRTTNCGMTWPGGYCDPNGDGSYSDADWVRGYNEYHANCL